MADSLSKHQITARRLGILATLVGLSLIPATLLFLLFGELNNAVVEQIGLKLGGPVAAFFATLFLLWRMYKEIRFTENPLEMHLQSLIGSWQIESISANSDRRASSSTSIELDDGEVRFAGGTFFSVESDGTKGKAIGSWNVEMAVSDGHRLKYFYNLTDSLGSLPTSRGLAELALQEDSAETIFEGTWQALGKEFHTGNIRMVKKKPSGSR